MPVNCSNCATTNADGTRICSLCNAALTGPAGEKTGSFEVDIRGIVIGATVAGRYLVKEMLGRGGVAMVFRASDTTLGGEEVALKLFPNLTRQEPADVERFKREVLVNRRISHVNVIRVYDFGTVGDDGYLTMELLAGGTLAEKIEAKPLPIAEAVEIAIGISEGLQAAHAAGIVHRDVKPENVLFDASGRPKLVDFGLARLMDASTHTQGFSGTPFYMSPEQAEGGEITAQTDVYSLGVLLFELFTGQLPFFADSLVGIASLHLHEIPPKPSALRPGLPVALEQLVLACLAKTPGDRPQGVGAVAASLRKFRRDGGLDSARGLDSDPSFSAQRRRARLPSDSDSFKLAGEGVRASQEKTLEKIPAPGANRETLIVRVDRPPVPRPSSPPREAPIVRARDLAELPMPGARRFPVARWLLGAGFIGSLGAVVFFGAPPLRDRWAAMSTPFAAIESPAPTPIATVETLAPVASPSPEGYGTVELTVSPWALVSVDGEEKAGVNGTQAKYELRVRAGLRELRVKNNSGYDRKVSLRVRAGKSCAFPPLFLATKPELLAPPGCSE